MCGIFGVQYNYTVYNYITVQLYYNYITSYLIILYSSIIVIQLYYRIFCGHIYTYKQPSGTCTACTIICLTLMHSAFIYLWVYILFCVGGSKHFIFHKAAMVLKYSYVNTIHAVLQCSRCEIPISVTITSYTDFKLYSL